MNCQRDDNVATHYHLLGDDVHFDRS